MQMCNGHNLRNINNVLYKPLEMNKNQYQNLSSAFLKKIRNQFLSYRKHMRVCFTDKRGVRKGFFNSFLKWSHIITKILVNNGSDNGLLPHASKLLPEPMLTWGLPSAVSQKSLKTKLYADKTYRSKFNFDDLYASARRLRVINTCITLCLLHSDYNDM